MSEIDHDSVPVLEDETATPRPEEEVADVARAEPDVTPHPGDAASDGEG
ncbi:hypothetical protein NUM3379_29770 [Kineococcus sp. NUM-3379]